MIVMECENFTVSSGFEPRPWLHSANRFAASVADTYLSRRAYLHAPANATSVDAVATMDFEIKGGEAGIYEALLRYESAFKFETPVHLTISAKGAQQPLFSRIYGQRNTLKVFPFGSARLGPYGNGTGFSMCGPGRPVSVVLTALATLSICCHHADCCVRYGAKNMLEIWSLRSRPL